MSVSDHHDHHMYIPICDDGQLQKCSFSVVVLPWKQNKNYLLVSHKAKGFHHMQMTFPFYTLGGTGTSNVLYSTL